ncbi:tripartite motif-containing protein 5 isoform X1 [Rousettus aegyptiacus]|uniref:tripartite motif-containing protein 5 isoform X1 n=1 Tax=Rousettus aegyptiacus TaxID=9407 RepID=UPI00168D216E|nr:tripartite motif-containing protein 5 isoform X1 [Rousettus aegyptiacus]XP_036077542.1 tripartite motif-containing protein 5 isoform X1 [Rousettus aegyptiacus]XP_036077543.1 tripartite motif-containing protein 5 isoform X1 [Rousettus aegyptiacus]
MATGILVNIQEEVTCPICLELLTEPLSLDCGHSFCQTCITAHSKEFVIGQGVSSCPVCRVSYQPENLRPNVHLANIADQLREVRLSPEEEQKRDLCGYHGEKLLLFCKEDGKFICWLCERSQEHRGHHAFLVEEVAQEYQETLESTLEKLRKEQQEAEKLEADIKEERTSWKNQIQNERHSVHDGFKQLRGILDSEEQRELQKLKKEEGEALHYLAEAENELVQQKQLVKVLISDLERRLKGSKMEMLQDVNGIMERSKTFTLKKPKTIPNKQRRMFQVPDLRGMLQVFNELTDVRRYWVHMILDLPENNPNVAISADRRQVRYVCVCNKNSPYWNDNCNDYSVLGSPSITSGKHYWEVDVSMKSEWILGVYGKKCPDSKLMGLLRQGKSYQHGFSRYQPKYGYWVIGLQNQLEYNAFEDSSSPNPLIITLSLNVPPSRVGVFIDYKAGTVSFFNVTSHGFLIYKFSSCSFSQEVFPYFNPMKCAAPMTLSSPNS